MTHFAVPAYKLDRCFYATCPYFLYNVWHLTCNSVLYNIVAEAAYSREAYMSSTHYIRSMSAHVTKTNYIGMENGCVLKVTVSFDAKQFSALRKKKINPLAQGMPQIKNVVFDATGIQGHPSYARASYSQEFPRAKCGTVTLTLAFPCDIFNLKRLGVDGSQWSVYKAVELQKTLEATRDDGHLFSKAAMNLAIRGAL